MNLRELLAGTGASPLAPLPDVEVRDVTIDLSEVRTGCLFVARRAWYGDTHSQLDAAVARGAVAVVISRAEAARTDVPCALVPSDDPFLARVSARLYAHPTRQLAVYGVTGTNGKTSVTWLLEHLLGVLGERPAVMGTTGYRFEGHRVEASNTTPDAIVIQRFARDALALGATALVLEVSSHGLALDRVAEVAFDAVGFTNLSQDHLDFHGTMEAYGATKARLFGEHLEASLAAGKCPLAAACLNDDAHGGHLLSLAAGRARTIAIADPDSPAPPATAEPWRLSASGDLVSLLADGARTDAVLPLIGAHNHRNAALAVAMLQGRHPGSAAELWRSLIDFTGIPGRLSRPLRGADRPTVLVDYAHTADAVSRVLTAVRDAVGPRRRVVVLGCGGDRDRGKRPHMARAAANNSEICVFTSDNPRSEPPLSIIEAMRDGLDDAHCAQVLIVPDRSEAIATAIAATGDGVCVLCGKGHEATQTVGDRVYHLDDSEEARRAVAAMERGCSMERAPIVSGWSDDTWAWRCGGAWHTRPARLPMASAPTLVGLDDSATLGARGDEASEEGVLSVAALAPALSALIGAVVEEACVRRGGLCVVRAPRPSLAALELMWARVVGSPSLRLDGTTLAEVAAQAVTLTPAHRLVLLADDGPVHALEGERGWAVMGHDAQAHEATLRRWAAELTGGKAIAAAAPRLASLRDPRSVVP